MPTSTHAGPRAAKASAPASRAAARPALAPSAGQALRPDLLNRLESRFGWNFAAVRLHADTAAAAATARVRATAFTSGSDIAFARDALQPDTPAGFALLSHELAHVVQQHRGAAGGIVGGDPGALEGEAAMAAQVPARAAMIGGAATPMAIQRQSEDDEYQLWLNRQLSQDVVATSRTRGFDKNLSSDLQKGADAFGPRGRIDAGHPPDEAFATMPAGTRSTIRAQPIGPNRSAGATTDKAAKAQAEAAGKFVRQENIDTTVPKGTRFGQPAREAWRDPIRGWDGPVSTEEALTPFSQVAPSNTATVRDPAEIPRSASPVETGAQLELPSVSAVPGTVADPHALLPVEASTPRIRIADTPAPDIGGPRIATDPPVRVRVDPSVGQETEALEEAANLAEHGAPGLLQKVIAGRVASVLKSRALGPALAVLAGGLEYMNLRKGQHGQGESAAGGVATTAGAFMPQGPWGMAANAVNIGASMLGAPEEFTSVTKTAADIVPANAATSFLTVSARAAALGMQGDGAGFDRLMKEVDGGAAGMPLEGFVRLVGATADLVSGRSAEDVFLKQHFGKTETTVASVLGVNRLVGQAVMVRELVEGHGMKRAADMARSADPDTAALADKTKAFAKPLVDKAVTALQPAAQAIGHGAATSKTAADHAMAAVVPTLRSEVDGAKRGVESAAASVKAGTATVEQKAVELYEAGKAKTADIAEKAYEVARNRTAALRDKAKGWLPF